ncbi:MAG: zf-HC2 domain-containing protein [Clostridia bacterium]|nr:zf-HC2 domain-containing protein [Clostridia bacterium]
MLFNKEMKSERMPCGTGVPDLFAYSEGKLSGPRKRIMERHLAECGSCRRWIAEAKAGRAASGRLRTELLAQEPPQEAFEALRSRLRAEAGTRPDGNERVAPRTGRVPLARRIPAWSAVAAALLVLAVLTPFLLRAAGGADHAAKGTLTAELAMGETGYAAPVSNDATSLSVPGDKNAGQDTETRTYDPSGVAVEARIRLETAGLSGQPLYMEKDGSAYLAVWFSVDTDVDKSRAVLLDSVRASLVSCEIIPDIEIMEGKTPIGSDDSPERSLLQETLGFLPQAEASDPDESGYWLILFWQVEN